MYPINLAALLQRMTGKSMLYQVQNGEVFMKTGRVVSRIEHMSDYADGTYKSGEAKLCNGEYDVQSHFLKKNACDRRLQIPLMMLWAIYEQVKTWRRTAGKDVKDVVVSIKRESPNTDWTVVKVFGEGKHGEYGSLSAIFHINTEGQEFDTSYRFKIDQLIDFLYIPSILKDKTPMVELSYQVDEKSLINDKPLFLTWQAYDRTFCVGHQVVKDIEVNMDQSDSEAEQGSFLNDLGDEAESEKQVKKPKSPKPPKVKAEK